MANFLLEHFTMMMDSFPPQQRLEQAAIYAVVNDLTLDTQQKLWREYEGVLEGREDTEALEALEAAVSSDPEGTQIITFEVTVEYYGRLRQAEGLVKRLVGRMTDEAPNVTVKFNGEIIEADRS